MSLKWFLVSWFVCCAAAQCKKPWEVCPNTPQDVAIDSVIIPNCCDPPCPLPRGKNTTISVAFETRKDFASISQEICGEISGICIPFGKDSITPTNLCEVLKCPFKAGKHYSVDVTLPIPPALPPMEFATKWKFLDGPPGGNNTDLIGCIYLILKVVEPSMS